MRKDVQIGFVIGVVLLAVLVVYVLVVPGGNKHPADLALSPEAPALTTPDLPATRPSEIPTVTITSNLPPTACTTAPTALPVTAGPTVTATPAWPGLLSGSEQLPSLSATRHPTLAGFADPLSASTTQPSVASAPRTHKVQSGETLSSIAKAAYGDERLYTKILAANPRINPRNLRVGSVIVLPDLSKAPTAAPTPPTSVVDTFPMSHSPALTSAAPAVLGKTYKVQAGDTLHDIAVKVYNKPAMWQKIYDLNKATIGSDPGKLKLHMVLRLPEAPTAPAVH